METVQLISNYQTYLAETHPEKLKSLLKDILVACEYDIVGFTEKHFSPQGYTCVWILAESHLAVHTFPENNLTYIELSSCNAAKNEQFKALIREWEA